MKALEHRIILMRDPKATGPECLKSTSDVIGNHVGPMTSQRRTDSHETSVLLK